ncbi:HPr family phosphocarrier protein, partial [Saccharothrix algeriensis]
AAGAGVAAVGAAAAADAAAGAGAGAAGRAAGDPSTQDGVREEVLLANEVGFHARPAALLARSLAGLDARVVVRYGGREADAASVLALMGLGAPGGSRVEVVATGPDAAEAVRRVGALAARHFDE